MTADVTLTLHRAAEAMRETATGATPGPWEISPWDLHPFHRHVTWGVVAPGEVLVADAAPEVMSDGRRCHHDAAHIASWHPTVALAVADWLDDIATRHQPTEVVTLASGSLDPHEDDYTEHAIEGESGDVLISDEPPAMACTHRPQDEVWPCPEVLPALVVARAYLGEGS